MPQLVFLGTSSMVPTKERNVQSILLDYNGELLLFDCGEGTQRQLNIAGYNRGRIKKIFISHWHGDHVSGLVGLIQTLGNQENEISVKIFGPKGTKEKMAHLLNSAIFENKVELDIKEINLRRNEVKKVFETDDYIINCALLHHSVPVLGYSFLEKDRTKIDMKKASQLGLKEGPKIGELLKKGKVKIKGKEIKLEEVSYVIEGKKFTLIPDTLPCDSAVALAENSDILVTESTYTSDLKEKALQYKHLTTKDAADIAMNSNSKKLILTHFSQRYKDISEVEEDAKTFFKNVRCAFDFMKVKF